MATALTTGSFSGMVQGMYESNIGDWTVRFLRVTAALYRVTGLLPAGEPLRTTLRKHANDVLAGCIAESHGVMHGSAGLESKIETLLGFITVAHTLPEVKQENFFVLEREYRASVAEWARELKTRAGREQQAVHATHQAPANHVPALAENPPQEPAREPASKGKAANERHRAILERLAQTPRVKVSDFYEIFQGISPKTIQRDLQELVSKNVIKKEGEKRWTIYMRGGNA